MTEGEQLIKLLWEGINLHDGICRVVGRKKLEEIADYLLKSGVTIPVRCKDCKRYRKSERAQTLEIGWCNKWHNIMEYFDFCPFGEREDNE